ncbi:MAG: O-antigen ligase family protein, partial [Patescibacteria group bacterium]
MLFYAVANSVKTTAQIKKIFKGIAVITSVLIAAGLCAFFVPRSWSETLMPGGGVFAALLLPGIVILEACLVFGAFPPKYARLLAVPLIGAVFYAFFSHSNALILALLLTNVILLIMLYSMKSVFPNRKAGIIVFIVILAGMLVYSVKSEFSAGSAANERTAVLKSAAAMFAARPVTGQGLGAFENVYPRYKFPADGLARFGTEARSARCEYFQIAAEAGIIGIILVLWFVFKLSRLKTGNASKETNKYFIIAVLGVHSMLIYAWFDSNLHMAACAAWFAVLLGITVSAAGGAAGAKAKRQQNPAAYLAALTAVLCVIMFLNVLAEYFHRKVESLGLKNKLAEKYFQAAISLNPLNAGYFNSFGVFKLENLLAKKIVSSTGAPDEDFNKAVLLDGINGYYFRNLARYYAFLGVKTEKVELLNAAIDNYSKAADAYPCEPFIRLEFARFLMKCEKYFFAERILKETLKLEPNFADAHRVLAQ